MNSSSLNLRDRDQTSTLFTLLWPGHNDKWASVALLFLVCTVGNSWPLLPAFWSTEQVKQRQSSPVKESLWLAVQLKPISAQEVKQREKKQANERIQEGTQEDSSHLSFQHVMPFKGHVGGSNHRPPDEQDSGETSSVWRRQANNILLITIPYVMLKKNNWKVISDNRPWLQTELGSFLGRTLTPMLLNQPLQCRSWLQMTSAAQDGSAHIRGILASFVYSVGEETCHLSFFILPWLVGNHWASLLSETADSGGMKIKSRMCQFCFSVSLTS